MNARLCYLEMFLSFLVINIFSLVLQTTQIHRIRISQELTLPCRSEERPTRKQANSPSTSSHPTNPSPVSGLVSSHLKERECLPLSKVTVSKHFCSCKLDIQLAQVSYRASCSCQSQAIPNSTVKVDCWLLMVESSPCSHPQRCAQ